MKACPVCGGALQREERSTPYHYKDHTLEIMQSGEYCSQCGEALLSPQDLKSTRKQIADFKRHVDHLLTTDEVRAIRKKLNLTQERASMLFGGGVRAFHKYETGENAQSRSLDILLKLLNRGIVSVDDLVGISIYDG